ncbi:MAG: M24 family metallopeptidase [Gammaproteobacteria bacterium]|nr:M24 family metallopeptidase [Gammaproteobacteria bacterium]MDH5309520.1 M24 family metallopeptidase [Gammaproteobacteria bacterium]
MTVCKQFVKGVLRYCAGALAIAVPVFVGPASTALGAGAGHTSLAALEYREGHREAAVARRNEFMRRMTGGLSVITSADRSQPNLYEFYTPDTEHKDFVFLTGIYDSQPPGHILVLNPGGKAFREVLYTDMDPSEASHLSGISHVFPRDLFLDHISSALTDYRNLRITQQRFKEVASDYAYGWGDAEKMLYVNYPRFSNLNDLPNPRLDFVDRLHAATSELELRDAGDLLDPMRMILDDFAMKNLRRAIEITGEGLMEGMKVAKPGLTTLQVMHTVDYVYRLHGADLGFLTGVSPASNLNEVLKWETTAEEEAARKGDARILEGSLVHFDTGASMNHYSADIQRTVPADGRFSAEQRRVYQVVVAVQKAVIGAVRPGVTWNELHEMAMRMLREAGGWDESYTYGIGHFIGMEVHEHGDYTAPLQPGMVIAIEQGAVVNGTRVAFEDDVLVTKDGSQWLTRFIPIEIEEVEALLRDEAVLRPARLLDD